MHDDVTVSSSNNGYLNFSVTLPQFLMWLDMKDYESYFMIAKRIYSFKSDFLKSDKCGGIYPHFASIRL